MSYHSPLGFNRGLQRQRIREKAVKAALCAYNHRGSMSYSEGWDRWSGIAHGRRAYRHQFPEVADCSAFTTWCLWDATRAERTGDFVNGLHWQAGYTGTQTQHGEDVGGPGGLLIADLVFYGGSWDIPAHVAIYIGSGRVVSHGQPGDPRVYPTNLYGAMPITRAKRYIR
jgi:cell wall-associated NlpC family hydrolase